MPRLKRLRRAKNLGQYAIKQIKLDNPDLKRPRACKPHAVSSPEQAPEVQYLGIEANEALLHPEDVRRNGLVPLISPSPFTLIASNDGTARLVATDPQQRHGSTWKASSSAYHLGSQGQPGCPNIRGMPTETRVTSPAMRNVRFRSHCEAREEPSAQVVATWCPGTSMPTKGSSVLKTGLVPDVEISAHRFAPPTEQVISGSSTRTRAGAKAGMMVRLTCQKLFYGTVAILTWNETNPIHVDVIAGNLLQDHLVAKSSLERRKILDRHTLGTFGLVYSQHCQWTVKFPVGSVVAFASYFPEARDTVYISDSYTVEAPPLWGPSLLLNLTNPDKHLIQPHPENRHGPIGGGGFGELYRGFFLPTGHVLAMKKSRCGATDPATNLRRDNREASLWKKLIHANVLPFFGIVDIWDGTFLVSPWAHYGDLAVAVRKRQSYLMLDFAARSKHELHGLFSRFNAILIIMGICSGLAYLHSRNVVHGDVKPANVLLDQAVQPLLCDFGLSKGLDPSKSTTSTGLKGLGSVRWMAPELLVDDHPTKSTESDVYAFGMVIGEVFTGKLPFAQLSRDVEVVAAIMIGDKPPFGKVQNTHDADPNTFWDMLQDCIRPNPEKRPTMPDLQQEMNKISSVVDPAS